MSDNSEMLDSLSSASLSFRLVSSLAEVYSEINRSLDVELESVNQLIEESKNILWKASKIIEQDLDKKKMGLIS